MRLLSLFLLPLATAAVGGTSEPDRIRGLLRDNHAGAALAAATQYANQLPGDAQAHALLGSARLAQGDHTGAVTALERAAQFAPEDSEIHRRLGDAYLASLDSAGVFAKLSLARKCRIAYERAVTLDPTNVAARRSVLGFYVGAPALFGGDKDRARTEAAEIMRLDPGQGHLVAGMFLSDEKKYPQAVAEFERALQFNPESYLALYQIGRLAVLTGEGLDRGIETLRRALALPAEPHAPDHAAAHWRLGMLHELKGDREAARTAYRASLALNPSFKKAARALARLH